MMNDAYTLSEELKLPVLMRVVTRLAHSRAGVKVGEVGEENQLNPDSERTIGCYCRPCAQSICCFDKEARTAGKGFKKVAIQWFGKF